MVRRTHRCRSSPHGRTARFLAAHGELIRRSTSAQPQWEVLRPPGASSGELCAEDRSAASGAGAGPKPVAVHGCKV